jgi:hypothetical protein
MQFKNPEILYFLVLLIIPVLIHLFQLQKFVKVPFTNVAFLQKIQQQTRKSSRIKKWLILATRLLLLTALIFAFSQPYFSNKDGLKKQHTFIYLDNSLSTSSRGEKGDLLKVAVQEIIENTAAENAYSLRTNTGFYKDLNKENLKKTLLKVEKTPKKLSLSSVLLQIDQENKSTINTLNKSVLISDFQTIYPEKFTNVTTPFSVVKLEATKKDNLSIDSVFINNKKANNFTLNVILRNQGSKKNKVPIAIFNGEKLISKQSFLIEKDVQKTIAFTIKNTSNFLGKVELNLRDTYLHDNQYYFTLNNHQKTPILTIGMNASFLSKIYTQKEFKLTNSLPENINYNTLQNQQLIVLNELESIPVILTNSLVKFSKNGGTIVIIPNEKIVLSSYNQLLKKLNLGAIEPVRKDTLKITDINYTHPIFKNVFSKKVKNFQYPTVQSHYPYRGVLSKIVSFQNNTAFISQLANSKTYYISSALNKNNSNFLNSPLIVPVFYNFGELSFKQSKLAYRIDQENTIAIATKIGKDEILVIAKNDASFIPLQQTYQNKVVFKTKEQPLGAGFYAVLKENITIKELAYNYPKEESLLNFLDVNVIKRTNKNSTISSSIREAFEEINRNNEVHWLWKWFLTLAIVSLLLELLILKFYTP